jgi:hypothetical protein
LDEILGFDLEGDCILGANGHTTTTTQTALADRRSAGTYLDGGNEADIIEAEFTAGTFARDCDSHTGHPVERRLDSLCEVGVHAP